MQHGYHLLAMLTSQWNFISILGTLTLDGILTCCTEILLLQVVDEIATWINLELYNGAAYTDVQLFSLHILRH